MQMSYSRGTRSIGSTLLPISCPTPSEWLIWGIVPNNLPLGGIQVLPLPPKPSSLYRRWLPVLGVFMLALLLAAPSAGSGPVASLSRLSVPSPEPPQEQANEPSVPHLTD